MKNTFKLLTALALLAFGSVASAATINPMSIDFGTGVGAGGTVVDVNGDGTDIHGTNIAINAVNVKDAVQNNGGYTSVALLNFDTDAGTISIEGTMGVDAATGLTSSQTLFGGVINSWSYDDSGTIAIFTAVGAGGISTDLAAFVGADPQQGYEFVEFSLSIGNSALSTDLLITPLAGDKGIPSVPVPAAAWLFGSGLIGMVGVARRKKTA